MRVVVHNHLGATDGGARYDYRVSARTPKGNVEVVLKQEFDKWEAMRAGTTKIAREHGISEDDIQITGCKEL